MVFDKQNALFEHELLMLNLVNDANTAAGPWYGPYRVKRLHQSKAVLASCTGTFVPDSAQEHILTVKADCVELWTPSSDDDETVSLERKWRHPAYASLDACLNLRTAFGRASTKRELVLLATLELEWACVEWNEAEQVFRTVRAPVSGARFTREEVRPACSCPHRYGMGGSSTTLRAPSSA